MIQNRKQVVGIVFQTSTSVTVPNFSKRLRISWAVLVQGMFWAMSLVRSGMGSCCCCWESVDGFWRVGGEVEEGGDWSCCVAKGIGKRGVLFLLLLGVWVSGEKERERGTLIWESFGHEKGLKTSFCCCCCCCCCVFPPNRVEGKPGRRSAITNHRYALSLSPSFSAGLDKE